MADLEEVDLGTKSRPDLSQEPSFSNFIRNSSLESAQVIPITISPLRKKPSHQQIGQVVSSIHRMLGSPSQSLEKAAHILLYIIYLLQALDFKPFSYLVYGTIFLSLVFSWQLYTLWLLVQLHESESGTRYSRYVHLAVTAFGPKLGKLLTIFPVMYLSGGMCVQLIIIGGGTIQLLIRTVCKEGATCNAKPLTGTECYLVFMCMAIVVAQCFPNLNSIARVSLIGTITAIVYCTMIWALSIGKGRPRDISYYPLPLESTIAAYGEVTNVILEIQGTLPSSPKHPSHKRMWSGVTMSYVLIAMCLFPLAIGGYWAYGNKEPFSNGAILKAISQFHGHNTSQYVLGLIYIIIVINCLATYQIYGMVVFDNIEIRYTSRKKERCPRWLHIVIRLLFGGLTFFIAVAFPFLGSLSPLIGGFTSVPLTYAYPCFMWIAIKKPRLHGGMWCTNVALGCFGLFLSLLFVAAAAWNLAVDGLTTRPNHVTRIS
ncbi:lysine histidine transporter-like 8 [Prunus yedoensis var. nudiflora]|uniref:Lysine histidine transporter-like 8 n=1 Tax=Prunus yedoensis var. nudiflora TaxID=2094558 RepID=A0A314XTC4_PRUYE|nr:lysine histidine transporter-like 8 [Prunus yedoensis var. nudiflora]